jgi:hypothetical protein
MILLNEPEESKSTSEINQWFDKTLASRCSLNVEPIYVQSRVHIQDESGFLIGCDYPVLNMGDI